MGRKKIYTEEELRIKRNERRMEYYYSDLQPKNYRRAKSDTSKRRGMNTESGNGRC